MSLSKSYLIVYNIAQWIGWSLVLFQTLRAVLNTRDASDVYAAAGPSTRENCWTTPCMSHAGHGTFKWEE